MKMVTARKRNFRSINELPDSILGHILSFLDTRDAVRTSVLSTRWKHLYVSAPNLHVCDTFIQRDSHKKSLMNCIDKFLFVHLVEPLERFHLVCDREKASFTDSQVSTWICNALRCEVEKLTLCNVKRGLMSLPQHLFRCESLVSLDLSGEIELNISNDIWLPQLTSVSLRRITIVDYDYFEVFIRHLLVLKDLVMEECCLKLRDSIRISSPALVKLTINEMRTDFTSRVIIKAANLLYISITSTVDRRPVYTLDNVESLSEAHFNIAGVSTELVAGLPTGIEAIKHVHTLHLSESTLAALSHLSSVKLPIFKGLRCLKLQATSSADYCPVLHLLMMKAPLLETLIFEGSMACWYPRRGALSCSKYNVKDIIFRPISVGDIELKTVEYFLKNADFLEKLVIHLPDEQNQIMVAKKLLSFRRSSVNCVVLLLD